MMWTNGWMNGMGGQWWLLLALGTVAFWAVVVLVVRSLLQGGTRQPPPADPLRLLDERLARGDIDREEYQQRRRLIVNGH